MKKFEWVVQDTLKNDEHYVGIDVWLDENILEELSDKEFDLVPEFTEFVHDTAVEVFSKKMAPLPLKEGWADNIFYGEFVLTDEDEKQTETVAKMFSYADTVERAHKNEFGRKEVVGFYDDGAFLLGAGKFWEKLVRKFGEKMSHSLIGELYNSVEMKITTDIPVIVEYFS